MIKNIHRPRVLLMLFAAAVLVTGLLALVGTKPVWAAEPSFVEAGRFTVGSVPTTVTSAEFNGDGTMDLAAQNAGSDSVSVLLGSGNGTFTAKQDFSVGATPSSVTSADLNDDGNVDLAISNQSDGNVSVLLGKGDGTFTNKQDKLDFAVGGLPSSVISADLNNDDYADLALASYGTNTVAVLLGQDENGDGKSDVGQDFDGDGSIDGGFNGPRHFDIDPRTRCSGGTGDPCLDRLLVSPNQVIAEDFNSDGRADLATANVGGCLTGDGGISVLLGKGDGSFQDAQVYSMGLPICDQRLPPNQLLNVATSITAADVNGDGKVDLAATIEKSNVVSVLRSNGDGTFQSSQAFSVGSRPSAVTSADLDGDAKADDLAVSNFGSDNVSVLFNSDAGGFQAAKNFAAGDGPIFLIGAALNTDSFADLAVANQNSNNVSVLINTTPPPPPPETAITSGPPDPDNRTSATFSFSSSEPGSTFQCALDDPTDYSPCTSPKTVPGEGLLAEGSHTFYVKASGAAGRTDPTPATHTWMVDITAPATPVISSPPEGSHVRGSFTVSGTAEANSTVRLSEDATSASTTANSTGNWSIVLSGVTEGSHTYKAKATDRAGNASGESNPRTVTVDVTRPTVVSMTPLNQATSVARGTNLTATFSEKMRARTINATTFKLFKVNPDRSTTQITDVVVTLSTDGLKATLNPFGTKTTVLAQNTKYKAVVTTGTKDLAGNSLSQPKSWMFTTK